MANVPEPEKANWPQDLVDHVNLETPRFLLRQYEEGDAAAMLDFWETSMQPLMQWCAHALPWKDSPSETREQKLAACSKLIMWFHANTQQRKRWIPLAVIDKSTKALVGEVGTFTKDSLAATTFGYMTVQTKLAQASPQKQRGTSSAGHSRRKQLAGSGLAALALVATGTTFQAGASLRSSDCVELALKTTATTKMIRIAGALPQASGTYRLTRCVEGAVIRTVGEGHLDMLCAPKPRVT
eukprot:CAMPEP_0183352766 /NCGR_PEP_ID=MMETSP0164_2-20130417/30324_1 /TAXON_ID=221442 /ORGANISM="Coccolithus pelagicus ssp braarudi, Strain PLY182g" /LENGTH=239 /DNA_ID=CAMNT_0025525293 /DNA_START=133 /DNA_END=853 /DNA_ORIENTATION=+